jgi:hypothetical protein
VIVDQSGAQGECVGAFSFNADKHPKLLCFVRCNKARNRNDMSTAIIRDHFHICKLGSVPCLVGDGQARYVHVD